MAIVINLTPHSVQVYAEKQFINLEQINPTTWVADGVEGAPLAEYESKGVARISTETVRHEMIDVPGEIVCTKYGAATGVPEVLDGDEVLIVSLPMQSMARQAGINGCTQMVAPYKVVRSRANGSLVLGCMGFTY